MSDSNWVIELRGVECVEITAPSHVHVGNIDINGTLGRMYGTLGFALESPRLVLKICSTGKSTIVGTNRSDIEYYKNIFENLFNIKLSIHVIEEIPAHVGLGSTTPIALSIGYASTIIRNVKIPIEDLALTAGRSLISGLGLYAFKTGGFIVDGGFRPGSKRVPPLIFRAPVPESLSIVYAIPEKPIPRILELKAREDEILERLPTMNEDLALRNSRILAMGILPSIAEGDWKRAGQFLYEFNRGLGEYWASEQGGIYCCSEVEEIIDYYMANGAFCGCQSSWGPTAYALVPERRARELYQGLARILDKYGGGYHGVAKIDNQGARVVVANG